MTYLDGRVEIKFVTPKLLLHPNMAIVGSSDVLKNNRYGNVINQYVEVVRFNRAPTNDYEELVGQKTTLRVVNTHVLCNSKFSKEEIKDGYWAGQREDFIPHLRRTKLLHYGMGLGEYEKNKYDKVIDKSNTIFDFQFESNGAPVGPPESTKRYSIGLGFIQICIKSGIIPHIFGFDVQVNKRGHYWEPRPPAGKCHDIAGEQRDLLKLIEKKEVVFYE